MRWVLEHDVNAFAARVRPLLEAHIANNVMATVLSATIEGQFRAGPPMLAVGLDAGAHTCMLFTDLANPTSNKIYADVGYRRFGEWEETEFTPAPAGP